MRDFDEQTITDAVHQSFAGTPDTRLAQIMSHLVAHMHEFIRDVAPSFEEFQAAVRFLTATGQISDQRRQEFILLADVLGVSMLIDAINHRMSEGATETTVLGPFHVADAPLCANGADISAGVAGELLFVDGCVLDPQGTPLAGAQIDVWQSDAEGFYDLQRSERGGSALRARLRSDPNGRFWFRSIVPAAYPIPDDGPVGALLRATKRHPWRPAHVHFMIAAPGFETLITHVFVAEDQYLDSDAVFGVKTSLIADFVKMPPGALPDGSATAQPWRHLSYQFGLKPVAN
ncbi:hydroxyquinol 1,2-dioxygenase [Acidiphilium sp. MT5]